MEIPGHFWVEINSAAESVTLFNCLAIFLSAIETKYDRLEYVNWHALVNIVCIIHSFLIDRIALPSYVRSPFLHRPTCDLDEWREDVFEYPSAAGFDFDSDCHAW